jgi:GAF domain-containing protein
MGSRAHASYFKIDLGNFSGDFVARVQTYIEEKTLLPFTLFIRVGFLVMSVVWLFWRNAPFSQAHRLISWISIAGYSLYLLGLGYYAWRNLPAFSSLRGKQIQITADILFSALFYLLTADPGSAFVLTFTLPLMIAARYFGVSTVLKISALVLIVPILTLPAFHLLFDRSMVKYLPQLLVKILVLASVTASLARSEFLNRQLHENRRAYRRRLGLLVAQVELAQRQDIGSLVQAAVEVACKELRAESVSLFLYQDGRFRRQKSAGFEDDWFSDESYAPGEGITGQVGLSLVGSDYGGPVIDNDVERNPHALHSYLARYRAKLRSGRTAHLVAVPLNGSNRTFGILRAVNKLTVGNEIGAEGFTPEDRDMLASIAALVAFAYGSFRRDQKMHAVLEVSEALPRVFDEQLICQKIAEAVVGLGYPLCCVLLRESDDSLRVRALYGASPVAGESLEHMRELHEEQITALLDGAIKPTINMEATRWHVVAAWMRERNLHTVLRLPLFHQDRVIGIVEIYGISEHQFYPDEVQTLEVFIAQATMAIVNARLSEQNQEQFNQLKELSDIIASMIALDRHDALFEYVAHRAAALLHAEDCSIFWVNRERNTIDIKASHCLPDTMFIQKVTPIGDAPGSGLPAYVAATGKPLCFIGEAYKQHPAWDGRFLDHLSYLPSKRCTSLLLYPICDQRGAIVGVIKAENKFGRAPHEGFTRADQKLLDLLTTQISIAVDKIDRIQELRLLHESAQMITEVGEQREVLRRIARSACQVVRADLAVICPYDAARAELLAGEAVTYGQATDAALTTKTRESGLTRDALQSRNGYIVVDDLELEPGRSSEFSRREGVRSFIAVVLKARKVPVGILYCDFRRPRRFTPEEISNAQAFGELAAIAIANATLFARVTRTVQELSAVQQLTQAALTNVHLDVVLKTVIDVICDTLGFEMCTVALVNEAERVVETMAGRGISDEWKRMSRHSLDSGDIQAWTVNTGETAVIDGWDDRLDREIYERFKHAGLIRVFTPIRGREGIIGTVEAGYDKHTKAAITQQEVAALQRCLAQVALVIESARLLEQARRHAEQLEKLHEMTQQMDRAFPQEEIPKLLQLATDTAVMLAGPNVSAAIHIYDRASGDLGLQACSGAYDELLERHALLAGSEHAAIISSGESMIRSGPYKAGSGRPSACVPLKSGGEPLGTLCVVYNRDHWVTANEQKILELCAAQAATVLVNARAHRALTSSLDWLSEEIEQFFHAAIGQPLGSISRILENMRDGIHGPLTTKQAGRLDVAISHTAKLKDQLRRLRLVRQIEEESLELSAKTVPIRELVDRAIATARAKFTDDRIEVITDLGGLSCSLELDGERVTDVFVELLVNAIKFSPAGSQIVVRGEEDRHTVRILVCDKGRGIAQEDCESIFKKYRQIPPLLSNERAGAGLGLYLARKVVERHAGMLTVRSQIGQGSRFIVGLPK